MRTWVVLAALLIAAPAGAQVFIPGQPGGAPGAGTGAGIGPASDTAATHTAVTVTTTSTVLVAADATRLDCLIVNGGPNTVFLGIGTTASATTGLPLASGGSASCASAAYRFTGAIHGVTASGTSTVRVTNKPQ